MTAKTVTATAVRPARPGMGYTIVVAGLLALVAWALYLLVAKQWTLGLGVTGMNKPASWGLYIVNFVFFIGLSAGGILVSALAHVGGLKRYEPVGRIAEVLAIICLILAQMFIVLDLGRPDRLLNLFIYGWTQRWQSPLVWDVTIILAYLVMALGLFYYGSRADIARSRGQSVSPRAAERDRRALRVLAFLSVPGAVGLHSITAWLFGLMVSRPGWHTALMAPLFVTSAIVSGLALVTVVVLLSRRFLQAHVDDDTVRGLGRLLLYLIPVLGYLMFSEWLTVNFAGSEHHTAVFRDMMFGRFAPFFWFDFFAGLLLPFLILLVTGCRSTAAVGLAALLVVAGVWTERYLLVMPAQVNVPLYPQGNYAPTAVEWSLMLGVYAVGALLYLFVARRVPLVPGEEA